MRILTDNAKKLQSAIKRKAVLREVLHGTTGYKVKKCMVTFLQNGWYKFEIDGYIFNCKWDSFFKPVKFYFKNNKELENAGYCYEYGINGDRVKYASSLFFGSGTSLIPILWVLGEVLSNKKSYEYRKENEDK